MGTILYPKNPPMDNIGSKISTQEGQYWAQNIHLRENIGSKISIQGRYWIQNIYPGVTMLGTKYSGDNIGSKISTQGQYWTQNIYPGTILKRRKRVTLIKRPSLILCSSSESEPASTLRMDISLQTLLNMISSLYSPISKTPEALF